MITFGSLFAGIGGIDLGLERAGMRCMWQVEKDPFCRKVLAKHWPEVKRYEDVYNVGKENLKPVDLICGGFPCQPHSLAGKRKGAEDDRNLWPAYLRIVEELKPAWVVGENVPGIITTILDQVLSDLEGLDYETRTIVIPAAAFNAPHIRERVFILAHSNSGGLHGTGIRLQQQGRTETISAGEVIPDAQGAGWQARIGQPNRDNPSTGGDRESEPTGSGAGKFENVSDTQSMQRVAIKWNEQVGLLQNVSNTDGERFTEFDQPPITIEEEHIAAGNDWSINQWSVEPAVGRVAHGVPRRVDRLRALGNAVVPQVAEFIGRLIVEADNA